MEKELILEELKKIYPNKCVLEISSMYGLSSNKIFLVKLNSGIKIVFKLYPENYKKRLEKEINILKELKRDKIPAPKLIHSDTEKLFLIEEYIEGHLLYDEIEKEDFNPLVMVSVGKGFAQLHKLPKKRIWQDKNKINNKEDWIESVILRNSSNLKVLINYNVFPEKQIKIIRDYLDDFPNILETSEIYLCPIHGDYNPKNIIIDNLNVKGIFDFEMHRIGHNLNDLGIASYWYNFYGKKELFHFLLEGYSKIIEISKNDKKQIEVYYVMQLVGALSFLIKNDLDQKAVAKIKELLNKFFEKIKND
jgi:Ser/Thr protein kinase RdoA (MazF antagonist)